MSKLAVYCAHCGDELELSIEDSRILGEPCPSCSEKNYEAGYQEGKQEIEDKPQTEKVPFGG